MQNSGAVNPAQILGAAPTPSNAVTPTRDYEGHPPFVCHSGTSRSEMEESAVLAMA